MLHGLGIERGEGKAALLLTVHQALVVAGIGLLSAWSVAFPFVEWKSFGVIGAAVGGVVAYVVLARRLGAVALTAVTTGLLLLGVGVSLAVDVWGTLVRYFLLVGLGPICLLHASALAVSAWDARTGARVLPIVLAGSGAGTLLGQALVAGSRVLLGKWILEVVMALLGLAVVTILPLASKWRPREEPKREPAVPGATGYSVLLGALALLTYVAKAAEDESYAAALRGGAKPLSWAGWVLPYLALIFAIQLLVVPLVVRRWGVGRTLGVAVVVSATGWGMLALGVVPPSISLWVLVVESALRTTCIQTALIMLFLPLGRPAVFLAMGVVLGGVTRLGELAGAAMRPFGGDTTWRFGSVVLALAWALLALTAAIAFERHMKARAIR